MSAPRKTRTPRAVKPAPSPVPSAPVDTLIPVGVDSAVASAFETRLNSSVGIPSAVVKPSRYYAGFIVGIVGRDCFAWPVSDAGIAAGVTQPAIPRKGNGEVPFLELEGGTAKPYFITASTLGGLKAECRALFAKVKGQLHPRFGVALKLYDGEAGQDLPGIVLRDPRQVSFGYFQPRPVESVATLDAPPAPSLLDTAKKPALIEGATVGA